MGMMKNYLLRLLNVSDDGPTQDAIEWAITSGLVPLTYRLENDTRAVTAALPMIIETYQAVVRPKLSSTDEPVLEELRRKGPLAA